MGSQDDRAPFNLSTYKGSPDVDFTMGYLIMVTSLVFFMCINGLAIKYGPPRKLKSDVWRWRNTFVSWIHANFAGVAAIYCFIFQRGMLSDMILYCDWYLYAAISMSCGYFLYDLFDHIVNKKVLSNWEVMLHHFGVIFTLAYALHNRINAGYTVLALVIEVNSIFLHGRKLMQLIQWPFDDWLYKVVLVFNFVTFILYRGGPVVILTFCAIWEQDRLSFVYKMVIFPILVSMYFINVILLWRLFKTDVLRRLKRGNVVKGEKMELNGNSVNGHVQNSNHTHAQ